MTNLMSERARRMRREKGPAERRLWYKLRGLNPPRLSVSQQAPIGPYIADFCDHSAKLVVEVDGAQHGEPKGLAADASVAPAGLSSQGYRVLRFWNNDVLTNIDGVEIAIMLALGLLAENGVGEASNVRASASALESLPKKAQEACSARAPYRPLPPRGGGTGWGGWQNICRRDSPHP